MTPIWLGEATRVGRIDNLLSTITLEEKIGQLNMIAGPGAVTGPGELSEIEAGVRKGRIGSLLNVWGAGETRSLQRLATQESLLGVPLLTPLRSPLRNAVELPMQRLLRDRLVWLFPHALFESFEARAFPIPPDLVVGPPLLNPRSAAASRRTRRSASLSRTMSRMASMASWPYSWA
jgi:hypothetical protein